MLDSLLAEYEAGPDRVEEAIRGVPDHVLNVTPGPDQWSIQEILVHLSDAEIIAAERFRRLLGDDDAQVRAYDEVAWGDRLSYASRDRNLSMTLFRALRSSNLDLVRNTGPEARRRTAVHSDRGRMTLEDMLQYYVDHVTYHVNQIQSIKTANGVR